MYNRRTVLFSLAAGSLALSSGRRAFASTQAIVVKDVAGRTVSLAKPARRILLAQGRQLPALAIAHPQPVDLLAGIGGEFRQQDPTAFRHYLAAFPNLDGVPVVGKGTLETLSIEQAISVAPDVIILSRSLAGPFDASGASAIVKRFEATGIPVVVVDFHASPLQDTVPSLRLLGQLLDTQERTEAFIRFYQARLDRIRQRCAGLPSRPQVFMHAHAGGTDCCFTPGKGTFNDYIATAGGINIAARLVPGVSGQISSEQLLSINPDIYLATGGEYQAGRGGLVVGAGISSQQATDSLGKILHSPVIAALDAVQKKQAHGLWQGFNDNPVHIVAIEAMAKWFHPETFQDTDPNQTLDTLNRMLAVPMAGTYWVDAA
ncbi:hypothetical protein BA190_32880 [Labrys sp. WJW]|uniref:ABC transporter substrate-binding protein n=1 Tax=Labrys sp. WJW TaxID=1737983 RepID=UPI00082AC3F7|nr:ABC transporter substrate-binding protein [Labrys sp. WJW]OCC00656.1 hypothetical protein BA190_32880 [Labrys sp. WJW]